MMQEGNQKHSQSTLGLYIHVPFCSSTCDFCAFYQERPSKKKMESYFTGLQKEWKQANLAQPVDTVFVGGGTPGILQPDQLERLCEFIKGMGLGEKVEWTVELAPNEVTEEKLSVLHKGGVNRISLGVQTFDAELMVALGRKHGPEKVFRAYDMIRETGFKSVNLDLIFGIPHQTIDQWESDMTQAVELDPDHLSTYCLTFEEDTALYYRLAKGELSIDPEKEAAFYERAWEFLPGKGYSQYEVSNFAREGYACVHNLNTWKMNHWVGLGPSACSQYQGRRWKNPSNLEQWLTGVSNGFSREDYDEFQEISHHTLAEDALLFGLRMNQGINLAEIANRFGLSKEYQKQLIHFFKALGKEGLIKQSGEWISCTQEGRIRADAIAAQIPVVEGISV